MEREVKTTSLYRRRSSLFGIIDEVVNTKLTERYCEKVEEEIELWNDSISKLEDKLAALNSVEYRQILIDISEIKPEHKDFLNAAPDYNAYIKKAKYFKQLFEECLVKYNNSQELQKFHYEFCKKYVFKYL